MTSSRVSERTSSSLGVPESSPRRMSRAKSRLRSVSAWFPFAAISLLAWSAKDLRLESILQISFLFLRPYCERVMRSFSMRPLCQGCIGFS